MNVFALARRLTSFLASFALALVMAACTITSETNLVAEGEGAAPLPATFYFFTYTDKEGALVRTEDAPMAFTLGEGNLYADAAGQMKIAFVPLGADGTYLLSIAAADGSMYGLARLADEIMEIRMVLSDDVAAELQAAGAAAVTVQDGGIMLTDRATLDLVIGLIAEGKVTTSPLLGYVGESAEATVPATLVKDGDWYKGA
jgi:hypothetical protein